MDAFAALSLTLFAGLSTTIGGLIVVLNKKVKMRYVSLGLGASAGVMIYISLVELLPWGIQVTGQVEGTILFFAGFLVMMVMDFVFPEMQNPHHAQNVLACKNDEEKQLLLRTGILTAVVITIHNFPEGIVTFASSLGDIRSGLLIAFAVALHNVPEGISVTMPILCATGDKRKALLYTLISGLAEPLGAILCFMFLLPFITEGLIGAIMAIVAGVMTNIALDEILPTARIYGHGHFVILGVTIGMLVMAISLIVL